MINPRPCSSLGRQGFTLIELLIALVIAGIVLQLAVPSMRRVMSSLRSQEAATQVSADLAHARMVGVRSGEGATVVFDGPARYRLRRGRGASGADLKSVDLATEYRSVAVVRPDGVDSIVFDSRGLARLGAGSFLVRSTGGTGMRTDTLHVTTIGTVRRGR